MFDSIRCRLLFLVALAILTGSCGGCFDRAAPPRQPAAAKQEPERQHLAATPATAGDQRTTPRVRKAVVAGSWYFAEKAKLIPYLDDLFAQAGESPRLPGPVMALISPHAGYTFSGKAAAAGYKLLKGRDVRRVVVLAPSHHQNFPGASIPEVSHFETPLGLIPLDERAVARLHRCPVVKAVPEAEEREHSLEMQLPLLQRALPNFELVPILIGRLADSDYAPLATALAEIVDAHTVVVASSDFTHRGTNYSFEVPGGKGTLQERLARLDQGAIDLILGRDRRGFLEYVRRTGATICGFQPIGVLLELLAQQKSGSGKVVARYTSGDVVGNWDSTVSYVDIAFSGQWREGHGQGLEEARSAGSKVFPLSTDDKKALLQLARRSLEASVRRGQYDPSVAKATVNASLQRHAGAFVTLKCKQDRGGACVGRGDDLRGCIGTIMPVSPVWDTVAQRAASAALQDPRFNRVTEAELRHITVEVSVLTPPRSIKEPEEIIIGRHGIILEKDGASATFLPQVAPEQKWDRETTLRHLAMKAGLDADGWRGARFQVYEAIVMTEGE